MSGFTLPSATLLAQSILSGIFVGALYGLLGLGLSLSWGLLRLINLAHFAFAFLAAYLCYQLATMGMDPLLTLGLIAPLFFAVGAGLRVTAAPLDHGLRPGSAHEADVMRARAGRFGAAFRAERVQHVSSRHGSEEQT